MKAYSLVILFFPIIMLAQQPAMKAPPRFVERALQASGSLADPISNIRVEIVRIADDLVIDPPVEPNGFERSATMAVTLNGDYFRLEFTAILDRLRTSKWSLNSDMHGYSKIRYRFLKPWNEVLIELYVWDEQKAVRFDDRWYVLDADVFREILKSLNDCVTKSIGGGRPR